MLEIAGRVLGPRAELRVGRLDDPLPAGPFEVIVSALAVHHVKGSGKADLFLRIAEQLALGGVFVMGDVVVTDAPVRRPAPVDPTVDFPSRIDELLYWLRRAGLEPAVRWSDDDLVVIVARKGTLTDATPAEATASEQPALHR